MDQPLIHDTTTPDGRPATEQEVADLLGAMTAADGTSLLDLYHESRDHD